MAQVAPSSERPAPRPKPAAERPAPRPRPAAERPAPRPLSKADRAAAVAAITAELRKTYVLPEKVPVIVARLEQAEKAGRYDVDDAVMLAERLTEDLRSSSGDGHLSVHYDPARYAAAKASGGEEKESDEFWRAMAFREHHGLSELRVLPGNIRYLKLTGFHWVNDVTGTEYDAALRFLKDGDAVVIDLRGNGGGSHSAVRYLVSHFMDGDVLEMTFLEAAKAPVQSRTLEHLPVGRLKGKPLYVLIDGGSASAAEAFAYDVRQFKLGELVGAKTVGAAHNNRFVPVPPGFMFSVSFGRPVHPVSNTSWEGTGVTPTVESPPMQALEMAQSLALTRLAKTPGLSPDVLADYEWARVDVEAKLRPASVPAESLKALAGRYGEFEVSLRDGALWMARLGRPLRRLLPLTADGLFSVEGSDRLRVKLTPRMLETLWRGDPATRTHPRS
ncbi:S41 family peptidase [Pyxidicoccus fallax]|uniref:S41 family peptidase n=2 Tax=Pyxidicoccus fallax TaxID=394095 RepID=A0A848LSV0_9BACT|nr:S41 family peptidase [Pyxidicoccus fallax]NPC82839.1 S41 family peptidase [Pyxidicoccus fallax]